MEKSLDSRIPRSEIELTKADFVSDQMVKWCPGCGNHAILSAFTQAMPKVGYKKENFVVVSGIGCSSRFPYYVSTYGFHSIHGRATAIATGMKIANPALSIWVNTGDGDSMAIGGNHFIHAIRRNIDLTIMLFNNRIYGLTKGQYSPTTPMGQITKTSPYGTLECPFKPADLVLGAQGTFFARAVDTDPKAMAEILENSAYHKGTAVVEILQNCVIFADKTHGDITDRQLRDERQIHLKAGEPALFGKNKEKGLRLHHGHIEAVEIGKDGITIDDILVHDPSNPDPAVHLMLAQMAPPHLPVALGIIRAVQTETFDRLVEHQIEEQKNAPNSFKNLTEMMHASEVISI